MSVFSPGRRRRRLILEKNLLIYILEDLAALSWFDPMDESLFLIRRLSWIILAFFLTP